ncbi:uncharacterized protein CXorf65 homolog [Scleropages formosus]|uniref:uncharacterized protein CXorf65 homolog n=1 Tax=Scleropages formosus TaxID=113540 RepID=UPI0008788AD9|nr:uncharacterized protein CXorf65 homolog [Scleropages formosus]
MFMYVKHGDNEQFLVNTNCPVGTVLQYVRGKLRVSEADLLDLCDEFGSLKLLFLDRQAQESATRRLPPRSSSIACAVTRAKDGAYSSIIPLLGKPDPALLGTLQAQADSLERARLMRLRTQKDRRTTAGDPPTETEPSHPVKGRRRAAHLGTADGEPQRCTRGKKGRG